jgi:hypothetical protein
MKADTLPADAESNDKLRARLAGLVLPTPKASTSARIPKEAAGKKYSFPTNDQRIETVELEFAADGGGVTLIGKFNDGAEQRIPCGDGEWKKGRVAFGKMAMQPAAVSGAWTDDDTYTAKICFYETPSVATVRLILSEDKLRLETNWNVAFGPTKLPQLVGERK